MKLLIDILILVCNFCHNINALLSLASRHHGTTLITSAEGTALLRKCKKTNKSIHDLYKYDYRFYLSLHDTYCVLYM